MNLSLKKAFTLIELLVVIAIIAILAAILFPVFAQAKAAAKATTSLSNVKQITLGVIMYESDSDDFLPLRRINIAPNIQLSWKQVTKPYMKNLDMFKDQVNPAAKYLDAQSDPALAALYGLALEPVDLQFVRGYSLTNLFYLNGSFADMSMSATTPKEPANLAMIVEQKEPWTDAGPYQGWVFNDAEPNGPSLNLGWSWGGKKWDDHAMVVGFFDGHAKREANHAICGKDNVINMWGYQRDQLNIPGAYIAGATLPWLDTYCQQIPAGF